MSDYKYSDADLGLENTEGNSYDYIERVGKHEPQFSALDEDNFSKRVAQFVGSYTCSGGIDEEVTFSMGFLTDNKKNLKSNEPIRDQTKNSESDRNAEFDLVELH